MESCVKGMNQEVTEGQNVQLIDDKINEGTFVFPHIRELPKNKKFWFTSSSEWESVFKSVIHSFLGMQKKLKTMLRLLMNFQQTD